MEGSKMLGMSIAIVFLLTRLYSYHTHVAAWGENDAQWKLEALGSLVVVELVLAFFTSSILYLSPFRFITLGRGWISHRYFSFLLGSTICVGPRG